MKDLGPFPHKLRDRYEHRGPLGRGGFASVYLATDKTLGRDVALKLYHPRPDGAPSASIKEAQLLGKLKHPNIIKVFDAGSADGQDYIVMEYLEGGSLRDKMGGAPMRQADALGLASVLGEALHALHEEDILHLDVKPENILFDTRGRPYLTDFGIGRLMGGDNETRQTHAMGTSNYAAPEQRQAGTLTPRSDIYSLGVVLFELLVGQVPLGPAPAVPQPPYSPPFPPDTKFAGSSELALILCKALAASSIIRYETAQEFSRRLREYLARSGRDTGSFSVNTTSRTKQFVAPNIARIQIREPEHSLRVAEGRRIPTSSREMAHDLPSIPQGTRVAQVVYSHQGLEIGVGALIEQGVLVRGRLRMRQDAIVRGDVISLTLIDLSQGVQARNVIAPEIQLRGPIRLEGSLFCRTLRVVGDPSKNPHLPAGSELGGSLIIGKEFADIVPEAELGRPLNVPRTLPAKESRPHLIIGQNCTMIGVLGDAHVTIEAYQSQLNTVRVAGDVTIGPFNKIRRIEGMNVTIGPDCSVDEVYARGKLIVGPRSSIGYMRAGAGIVLEHGVVISSPILYTDNGAIVENGEAHWKVDNREAIPLTAQHLFDYSHDGVTGGLGTALVDHRLYELYDEIAPNWQTSLRPAHYEGSGDQVRLEAHEPEEGPSAAPMDLIPASERGQMTEEVEPDDAPERADDRPAEASAATESIAHPSEQSTRRFEGPPRSEPPSNEPPSEADTRELSATPGPAKRRGPTFPRSGDE